MNKRLLLIVFTFIFLASQGHAIIQSKTSSGADIHWFTTAPNITLRLDTSNSLDLNTAQVQSALAQSISQFSSSTAVQFQTSLGSDGTGVSSISFTTTPYFSSGILAVTNVSYNVSSGEIREADILINEQHAYSTSPLATGGIYYLGDVLTHELGHLLGLAHSEVQDSTMIYTAFRGQWSLSQEDINGLNGVYAVSGLGTISGKIVGGTNLVGVLGSKIEVVSTRYGKVVAMGISDADGSFSIKGLPLGDTYYLYVSPLKVISSVPSYYASALPQVCSGANYRGSFFNRCGDSEKDRPQAIRLTSTRSSVNVGKVSIRCNYGLDVDYLDEKSATSRDERLLFDYSVEAGGALSGIFFDYEKLGPLVTTYGDEFEIDLTAEASPTGKYLDLKFISQSLQSPLGVSVYITRAEGINPVQFDYIYNPLSPTYTTDMVENLNQALSIPLSSTTNENIFSVRVVPVTAFSSTQLDSLFASPTNFVDPLSIYMMTASISQAGSIISADDDYPYQDNTHCPERTTSSETKAFTTNRDQVETSKKSASQNNQGLACGTVDMNDSDGPPSGPMNVAVGFFLMLLLVKFKKILGMFL